MTAARGCPIRCPVCREGSLAAAGAGERICEACGASHPLRQGIVDLLPAAPARRSPAQFFMEWDPLVRIYESRLWRRSRLARVLMGLSFEEEYARVRAALRLDDDSRVLDLACGSGIYARRFARELPDGAVVGLDLSWPMLAYAARAVAAEGLTNLVLIHGDAGELPFDADQVDAVSCCGALHLFPDVPGTLAEIARVLAPGGRFAAAVVRRDAGRAGSRRSLGGVTGFTRVGFAALCETAGLGDFDVLHEARGWLVATARSRKGRRPES
jgi:SAM-dependent methyltransferase